MKKLWHEPSECPEYMRRLVIDFTTWDGYHALYDMFLTKDYPVPWEEIVARDRIFSWCYFDDLQKSVIEERADHQDKCEKCRVKDLCPLGSFVSWCEKAQVHLEIDTRFCVYFEDKIEILTNRGNYTKDGKAEEKK